MTDKKSSKVHTDNSQIKQVLKKKQEKNSLSFSHKMMVLFVDCFLFFLVYFSRYSEVRFASVPVIAAFFVLLAFVVYFVIGWIHKDIKFHKYTFNLSLWGIVFVFLIYLSRNHNGMSLMNFFNIVTPVFFFILVVNLIQTDKDWVALAVSIPAIGIIFSIISYLQFISNYPSMTFLFSVINYNNTWAAVTVFVLFVTLGFYLDSKNKVFHILGSVIIGFLAYLIFLTTSRGGLLVFAISIVVFLLLTRKDFKIVFSNVWPAVLVALVLIIFGIPPETRNLLLGKTSGAISFAQGLGDASLNGRAYMMQVAFQMFLSSPIFGIGLGNFRYAYMLYNRKDYVARIDPHSWFFRLLSETGIIGTFVYFGAVISLFMSSFKKAFRLDSDSSYVYKGILAGVTGLFIHMCLDVDTYTFMYVFVFFAFALLVSYKEYDFVPATKIKKVFIRTVTIATIIVLIFAILPSTFAAVDAIIAEKTLHVSNIPLATSIMQLSCESQPYNDFYTLLLGYLYLRNAGRDSRYIDKAMDCFNQVIKLNPNEVRAYGYLGLCYLYEKSPKAITYLEIAHEKYPINSSLLYWLSFAHIYINNDLEQARNYYNLALEGIPGENDVNKFLAIGVIDYAEGKIDLAKANFIEYMNSHTNPANPFANKFGVDLLPFMSVYMISHLIPS